MRVPDIPLELLGVRLAQDGLLVGLWELGKQEDIAGRAADCTHSLVAVARLDGVGLRLLDRLRILAAQGGQEPCPGPHLLVADLAFLVSARLRSHVLVVEERDAVLNRTSLSIRRRRAEAEDGQHRIFGPGAPGVERTLGAGHADRRQVANGMPNGLPELLILRRVFIPDVEACRSSGRRHVEHQRKTALRVANVPSEEFEAAAESTNPTDNNGTWGTRYHKAPPVVEAGVAALLPQLKVEQSWGAANREGRS